MRLLLAILVVISIAGLDVSLGDSFFNPWFEFKVSLEAQEGKKIEDLLNLLGEKAKKTYPLEYELYLGGYSVDATGTRNNILHKKMTFETKSLGIIVNCLTIATNSRFFLEKDTIRVFDYRDAKEASDRFYLIPESLKLSEKTHDKIKKYFVINGLVIPREKDLQVDPKLKMLLVRGDESTHAKVGTILLKPRKSPAPGQRVP